MVMATVHVVGALAATIALGMLALVLGAWERGRLQKRRLQDASIALGVPLASLEQEEDEDLIPRLIQYSSQRYSGELLRNRVSDLCGLLQTVWGWLSTFLQIGIVVGVGWLIFSDGAQSAVVMWLVLAVALFFWLASIAFSFVCLLLTGRYPGEAKMARKAIAAAIEQRAVSKGRPLAPAWDKQ
jgi:hypothetical protein